MDAAVFIVAATIVLVGALGVVLRSNPVHCALSLVMTLFGIAVLFIAQEAQFLAAVQVIVYAGAIVVLFLFVIMLLGVDRADDLSVDPLPGQRPGAVIAGVAMVGLLLAAIFSGARAVTGAKSVSGALDPNEAEHRHARPVALHRLRLRVRAHLRPARHRGRRRGRARPTWAEGPTRR